MIKVVLAERGMPGKKLAEMLNVKPQRVSKWATNTNQPSIEFLYEIAGCLKVDVRKLLRPNDLEGPHPNLPVPLPNQQQREENG